MNRHLPLFLAVACATAFSFCAVTNVQAQTISYTSAPVTAAVEKVTYSSPVSAIISNNDELTFSAPVLPSWLTLNSSGSTKTHAVSDTVLNNIGGVAGDAQGNYYVVDNGYYDIIGLDHEQETKIYKITPDGKATLWTVIDNNYGDGGYYHTWNYGLIIHENYLYAAFYSGYRQGVMRFDMTQENPKGTMIYEGAGVMNMTYHDGYIYTANYNENKVGRINLSDNSYSVYINEVMRPWGLGFTGDGSLLIASYGYIGGTSKVYKFSNNTLTDAITTNSYYTTDVKVDAAGNVYVSSLNSKIRKYTPDLSNYVEIDGATSYVYSMYLTANGALVYADLATGKVFALQTGATLTGTPGHEHVGTHPVKLSVTNGSITKDLEFTITVTDPNAPLVAEYLPGNQSTAIAVDSTLQVAFNEKIKKGSGRIFIRATRENSILKTIDVADEGVSIKDDSILVIKSAGKLPYLTKVWVEMETGVVKDLSDNGYEGIDNEEFWAFTTDELRQVPQTIEFAASHSVVYGAADFDGGAYSDSKLNIAYSSSDESIASVVNGKIRVRKVGTVTITANQEGNDAFFAAEPVQQQLTITPAPLSIRPDNKIKETGKANPAFTFIYSGFVNGDNANDLTAMPIASTIATDRSPIGNYDIDVEGAASSNYTIVYGKGKLSVVPATDSRVKVWSSSPSELQVRIFAQVAQKSFITLYTDAGQPIIAQVKQLSAGINSFTVPVSRLASSMYVFHVNADRFQEAQRVKIK